MNIRIIYQADDGGVAVIVPSPEALAVYSVQAIAQKDVPPGKPYKIVDVADVPSDRTFRSAWEVEISSLTDGVGSQSNEF